MSDAYVVRRGGGGLNLKVVGGTSQPSGKENMIWVNTDEAINGYAFSATQPYRVSKNKNLIVYPYFHTTQTLEGVTWTDNVDGTLKANGTASSASSFFRCSHTGVDRHEMLLPPGTYHLSGCPAGGSTAKYFIEMSYSYDDWATTSKLRDFGSGVTFTLTAEAKARVLCAVIKTATVSNIVFKPQLEKGSTATSFIKGDATGMVWFKTATESTTPINVDKKNTVMLYPQTAQQYIGGAWVGKTAQVYTNGAWHELWDGYYYKLGETYEAITGGYSAGTSLAKVTFNSNNMVISQASGTSAGNVVATVETVDVTDVNTLVFDCLADSTDACHVGVGSVRDDWNNYIATANVNNTARALITLDVSSVTGEVYILLKAWFNSSTYKGKLTVYNIYKQ